MSPTIKDIAKKAGVSIATVSRVINNYPFIKGATKQKVNNVIEELNYYPDLIARSMIKKSTSNIGLIVGGLDNPFFAESAEIIIKAAEQYNCYVTLYSNEEDEEKLNRYIELLVQKRVDGVIIGSVYKESTLDLLNKSKIPYVFYNRRNRDKNTDYIIQDNHKSGFDATSHLISLGHTKIAMLHAAIHSDVVENRLKGYYDALKASGLKNYDHFVQEVGFRKIKPKVKQAIDELLEAKVKPTAIVASADFIALEVMENLVQKSFKVPDDIALVGFDNIHVSSHSLIGLTTVSQRVEEMSQLAVDRLMQKIEARKNEEEDTTPWKIKLQPKLIVRKTCGAKQG
ncbi:LacI family DNA-binding transcriptional regulator [Salipaludibacillus sp. HK11]|uniref:LacI family DNA-binding transcriptional regulator n=1 Tax=Salipaludibacillus sp. HK11 TaxID=3394320 RepID=UPI0039FD2BC4